MTVPLPYSTGSPISRWQVVDWSAPVLTSPPATSGTARVEFPQLQDDQQWLIDRAVASCTSTSPTSARLYDATASPLQLLSGTASGNFDEADYPNGLLVRPRGFLVAVWTGCSDGAIATLRLQVRLMHQGA